jgi:NAD(P)H-dependent FMN reductase
MKEINLLAIPGSLRINSASNAVLQFAVQAVESHINFKVYEELKSLPPFDDANNVPTSVEYFRQMLQDADGVLICTPEYAFGIPGVLKNALDWTVSSGEFVDKPVAIITAASNGEKAHAALRLVLSALSAKVADDATLLISFVKTKLDTNGKVTDIEIQQKVKSVLNALVRELQN